MQVGPAVANTDRPIAYDGSTALIQHPLILWPTAGELCTASSSPGSDRGGDDDIEDVAG